MRPRFLSPNSVPSFLLLFLVHATASAQRANGTEALCRRRGARLAVARADGRAAAKQQGDDGALHVEDGAVQRRCASGVARLQVQALVQQPGHLGVAAAAA